MSDLVAALRKLLGDRGYVCPEYRLLSCAYPSDCQCETHRSLRELERLLAAEQEKTARALIDREEARYQQAHQASANLNLHRKLDAAEARLSLLGGYVQQVQALVVRWKMALEQYDAGANKLAADEAGRLSECADELQEIWSKVAAQTSGLDAALPTPKVDTK